MAPLAQFANGKFVIQCMDAEGNVAYINRDSIVMMVILEEENNA